MSKGARFISAVEEMKNRMNPIKPRIGILKMNQSAMVPAWLCVMLIRLVEPEIITTNRRIIANEIS